MTDALKFEMAKRIVESSFKPIHCNCDLAKDGKVAIRLYDADNNTLLSMSDIESNRLSSIRGVAQIALELKQALASSALANRRARY